MGCLQFSSLHGGVPGTGSSQGHLDAAAAQLTGGAVASRIPTAASRRQASVSRAVSMTVRTSKARPQRNQRSCTRSLWYGFPSASRASTSSTTASRVCQGLPVTTTSTTWKRRPGNSRSTRSICARMSGRFRRVPASGCPLPTNVYANRGPRELTSGTGSASFSAAYSRRTRRRTSAWYMASPLLARPAPSAVDDGGRAEEPREPLQVGAHGPGLGALDERVSEPPEDTTKAGRRLDAVGQPGPIALRLQRVHDGERELALDRPTVHPARGVHVGHLGGPVEATAHDLADAPPARPPRERTGVDLLHLNDGRVPQWQVLRPAEVAEHLLRRTGDVRVILDNGHGAFPSWCGSPGRRARLAQQGFTWLGERTAPSHSAQAELGELLLDDVEPEAVDGPAGAGTDRIPPEEPVRSPRHEVARQLVTVVWTLDVDPGQLAPAAVAHDRDGPAHAVGRPVVRAFPRDLQRLGEPASLHGTDAWEPRCGRHDTDGGAHQPAGLPEPAEVDLDIGELGRQPAQYQVLGRPVGDGRHAPAVHLEAAHALAEPGVRHPAAGEGVAVRWRVARQGGAGTAGEDRHGDAGEPPTAEKVEVADLDAPRSLPRLPQRERCGKVPGDPVVAERREQGGAAGRRRGAERVERPADERRCGAEVDVVRAGVHGRAQGGLAKVQVRPDRRHQHVPRADQRTHRLGPVDVGHLDVQRATQPDRERLQLRTVAAGEDGAQPAPDARLSGQAPGVAARSENHDSLHENSCRRVRVGLAVTPLRG